MTDLGPCRKRLVSRFGEIILPCNRPKAFAALQRVLRLPFPYRVFDHIPLVVDMERIGVENAWREALYLVDTAMTEAWLDAGNADAYARGETTVMLESSERLLEAYAEMLRHASLGLKLLPVDPVAMDIVWRFDDWRDVVDEGLRDGSEIRDFLRGLPAWERACHKRRSCKKWVSRQLKRARERAEAHVAWVFGRTGSDRPWASFEAMTLMEHQVMYQREWARSVMMVRPADGMAIPMEDLVSRSVSSRRSEDYALAIALQQIAERNDLHFVMATITLPGEWSPKQGARASVWNGRSPVEANRYLKHILKLVRTNLLDGAGVCIGFCVTEPQATGVPHCHIMLLTDDPDRVERIVLSYKEDPRHQIDCRRWHLSPSEGRAASIASYLTKYLMKGKDLDAGTDDALAFAAWRRGCAARTTSWFGLGKGFKGRWRALYRAGLDPSFCAEVRNKGFVFARTAMSRHQWGDALVSLADPCEGVLPRPFSGGAGAYCTGWEPIKDSYENRYGEIVDRIVGFRLPEGDAVMLTSGDWEVVDVVEAVDWGAYQPDPAVGSVEPSGVDFADIIPYAA